MNIANIFLFSACFERKVFAEINETTAADADIAVFQLGHKNSDKSCMRAINY